MERDMNLLTSRGVETAKDGWHSDGNNLYLRVDGDRRRWIVRVTRNGKKRDIGCGALDKVSLAFARRKRDHILAQLRDGLDPVEEKRKTRQESQKKTALVTFRQAAEAAYKVISPKWKKGSSSFAGWTKTIIKDCKSLHRMPVSGITEDHVWSVIEPFVERNELVAAKLALNRIHTILACAKSNKWRSGDNPASWDIFQFKIPARQNGAKQHYPMLKWPDMPAFLTKLRGVEDSKSAAALELITFTACRSNEIRGLRWSEVDFDAKFLTIPPERMKRSVEFKVPLSDQAVTLLKSLHEASGDELLVFPGPRSGRSILNQTLWETMQRVTDRTATSHGLRASFATWASERGVPDELIDMCLAHGKRSQTTAAYNRAENVERRRVVMQDYANFICGTEPNAKIVPLARRKQR
jgi:integrase